MLIVADENIPQVTEAFAALGEVRTLPGRSLQRSDLAGAELLLVRSVTRVNAELLAGTSVRFVASATIGRDHLDTDWLEDNGIGWATAPGCNARAVAEWVVAALLEICARDDRDWRQLRAGIVGRGNVGQQVRQLLTGLGLECVVCDPPLAEAGVTDDFVDLERALDCDLLSLHTPLTRSGKHPTRQMIGAAQLARMRPGSLLFNSGRGEVVEGAALAAVLHRGQLSAALDVWENEPGIDPLLLAQVALATPHVAGYSYDGRLRGTQMIEQAACRFFGLTPQWAGAAGLPAPAEAVIDVSAAADPLRHAVQHACDLTQDDARLRQMAELPVATRGGHFDSLRKQYRQRREFAAYRVVGATGEVAAQLAALGFNLTG